MLKALRKLKLIAPEEIELAIARVAETSYGIPSDDVASDVCSLFGFQRVTKAMDSVVAKAVKRMTKKGKMVDRNGVLYLPE